VAGRTIAFSAWGDDAARRVVLVHGGGAHRHWWDHVAPLWADRARVLALDLSGHGDSSAGEVYSSEIWADEIVSVLRSDGGDSGIFIGHSMGGHMVLCAAAADPEIATHAVAIDSYFRTHAEWDTDQADREYRPRPHRVYATREEAVARFRLVPAARHVPRYIFDHVAELSIGPVPGGWQWLFDPASFDAARLAVDDISEVSADTLLVRGEYGLTDVARLREVACLLGSTTVLEVPGAGHHVPLEAPLELVRTLEPTLSRWLVEQPAVTATEAPA
jgi:pimeloyl-ACP methyl ester carboxylesterase